MAVPSLSLADARRLALSAQDLLGAPDRRGGVPSLLRRLSGIQLDTISVLARSHELVPYARLGAIGRPAVERALWGGTAFEYWAHAACVLPLEDWPLYGWRRARSRRRQAERGVDRRTIEALVHRLRAEGPLTATQLGGAKRGGPWWDWSEVKQAAEHALATGDVVCVTRQGWRRVYDLPERGVPPELLEQELPEPDQRAELLRRAARACGVGTLDDLADHHRQLRTDAAAVLDRTGLVPVEVAGWSQPAWALSEVLAAPPPRGRHRTTLLTPFDPMVWYRPRAERLLGLRHRLEAYTPAAKREHGYFAMPLLASGEVVGRVDPARAGRTLVARQVSLRSAAHAQALATALTEAASWVGCDAVTVERLEPEAARPAVTTALAERGVGSVR